MATNISFGTYSPPDKTETNITEITLGLFFDGTLNNKRNTFIRKEKEKKSKGLSYDKQAVKDDPWGIDKDSYENDYSNVARMSDLYTAGKNIYIEGIGTLDGETDTLAGYISGTGVTGIRAKVRSGCEKVFEKTPKNSTINLVIDVFGFSRGAAAARAFVNEITKKRYKATKIYDRDKNNYYYYDLDNKKVDKEQLPSRGYLGLLFEKNKIEINILQIRFAGLYDTVSSYGINFDDDTTDMEDIDEINLSAISNSAVKNVVQIAAGHEWRKNFNLTNINSVAGKGIQFVFPGCHCDIGGAYESAVYEQLHSVSISKEDYNLFLKYGIADKRLEPIKEKYKKELVDNGWYKKDQLKYITVSSDYKIVYKGTRYIDKRYSFISLHFMSEFASDKGAKFNMDNLLKKFNIPEKSGDKEHILSYTKRKLHDYVQAKKKVETNKQATITYKDFLDFHNEKVLINTNIHWSATEKTGHGPTKNKIRQIING